MISNEKDKEALVIDLLNKDHTAREIAKEMHISRTIGQNLNKATGDDEDEEKQKLKD